MSQSPIPPNTQRVMTSRGRAICSPPPEPPKAVDESDYFSDFDEEELEELNREVQRIYADKGQEEGTKLKEVQEDNPIGNDVEYTVSQEVARLPKTPSRNSSAHMVVEFEAETNTTQNTSYGGTDAPFSTTFVTYPDLSAPLSQLEVQGAEPAKTEVPADNELPADRTSTSLHDTRSPIERYRPAPRRALSVTDLVSPSWCEIQYDFHLSRHGKKRATPAMKAGSKVHEKLEEEVYTSVPVTVQTKEEGWGLRIWNVLAGLKTLRETGMTRELEVWGVLEGEVVGGVIDQVSFSCTDQELEAKLQSATDGKPPQEQEAPALEEGQQPLSSFLKSSAGGQTMAEALDIPSLHPRLPTSPATPSNLLYITDVKTRSAPSLPRGASFVPTKLQLMLYHRMLSQMISGFEFSLVARHYELDMHAPFSDEFIAQLASIDADLNLILSHKSLSGLWSLVRPAFAAVSRSPGQPVHVSKVLCAEYRDARTGDLRGTTTITYDEKLLDRYLKHEMGYWQGQRKPVGVEISDAWKCGVCEFAADCDWRKDRELEFRSRGRGRGYAYKRS